MGNLAPPPQRCALFPPLSLAHPLLQGRQAVLLAGVGCLRRVSGHLTPDPASLGPDLHAPVRGASLRLSPIAAALVAPSFPLS